MGTGGYKITYQGAMYFVSFAVVDWVDVFTRKDHRDVVIESLKYCQEKKGLIIYSMVYNEQSLTFNHFR